nr:paraquat-inducible protein A [Oceanicoccus sagamiensis]
MSKANTVFTARDSGYMVCHSCHKLHRDNGRDHQQCARCGDAVHYRNQNSLARTWALCLSSTVFLVFANVFPIMTVMYLGKGSPDTIISGVIALVHYNMIPIAIVVFIASVAVPLLKLLGLYWLLLKVHFNWQMDQRQCAIMFRMVQFIGRWSMLDLFVIAILVTLVDLGGIATITGGPAATYFSTVVVLTMLAAHTFDQRLIWDLQKQPSADR